MVFIPKFRRKALYGQLRKDLGGVFRRLAEHKESRVEDGHLMADHVHMLVSIPPKYAVAQVVGYLKGKSAIHIARTYLGRRHNYMGLHFLGSRVLRFDGWSGRGSGSAVHPKARGRGRASRPAGHLEGRAAYGRLPMSRRRRLS